MTLPDERIRAISQTRKFLVNLLYNREVPTYVKEQARYLLKHYPRNEDAISSK